CIAFHDIAPEAPTHFLVVPRKPIAQLSKAEEADAAVSMVYCSFSEDMGLSKGYRLVLNDGPHGGQEAYHIHIHVLGGRQMGWPPG
ncbi:HINT1 protein, partial [Polyodon spathula]|nr:HINT1 protein [Polyodon spathula]